MLKSDLQCILQWVHVFSAVCSTVPIVSYTELEVSLKGWLSSGCTGYSSSEHMKEYKKNQVTKNQLILPLPSRTQAYLEARFQHISNRIEQVVIQRHMTPPPALQFVVWIVFSLAEILKFVKKQYFGVTSPQQNNPKLFWIISNKLSSLPRKYKSRSLSLWLIIRKGVATLNWWDFRSFYRRRYYFQQRERTLPSREWLKQPRSLARKFS